MSLRRLRYFLRWGVYYNIELVWLNWLLPRRLPAGAALPPEADERRRRAHQDLAVATESAGDRICQGCEGCCFEAVNRYTTFDHIVRAGSASPITEHDRRIFSFPWMIWNGVRHAYRRRLPESKQWPLPECPHVTCTGCTLERPDRPMLCVSWFCWKYFMALTPAQMDASEAPMRVIEKLHHEALRAARHPARVREEAGVR